MAAGQGWPQATREALDRVAAVCYWTCSPYRKSLATHVGYQRLLVPILFFVSLSS